MLMRKIMIHACTLGVTLTGSMLVSANAAPWNGSYVAEGECFCTGVQGREIDSQIFPTPVGGQSVSQICDRIGSGPELQKVNGKFNFPVYADAQCGNGPFAAETETADEQCSGHLGVAGEDCVGTGPKWALEAAYAKPAAAEPGIAETMTATAVVTGGSRYILPPTTTTASESESAQVSAAGDEVKTLVDTPVAEIVRTRSEAKQIAKAAPLTKEEIRARQLVQMEAARERANLAAGKPSSDHIEIILTVEEQERVAEAEAAKDTNVAVESETIVAAETTTKEAVETSSESLAQSAEQDASAASLPVTTSALKLPVATRNSAREFDYVEGMPISYDFGGAGMQVAASISSNNLLQYVLRASAAETYREALIGVGLFLSPRSADRLTVLLSTGIEYGKFEFQRPGVSAELSDTGAYVGLSSRFVVNNRFELQAGVGYSSFFEGDAIAYGSAFYHLTPNLDITTKAEGGDNDSLGFGIRYYY